MIKTYTKTSIRGTLECEVQAWEERDRPGCKQ